MGATIEGCDFSGATTKLRGAWMMLIKTFKDTNFNGADLSGANLMNSILQQNVNFNGASLREALVGETDLRGGTFEGTILTGALYSASTQLPFSEEEAKARGMRVRDVTDLHDLLHQ